jgi:hypothetical protein
MPATRWWLACVIVAATAVPGFADDDQERELDRSLKHPAPGAGLDHARVAPPRWCGRVSNPDEGWAATIVNQLGDYRASHVSLSSLIEAARTVCNAPNRPAAQRAAAEIEQYWINATGLTDADAVASLAARFDGDAFEADRDKLCQALGDPSDGGDDDDSDDALVESHHHHHGTRGAAKLAAARQTLLGCGGDAMWMMPGKDMSDLAGYIDRGPLDGDPLARAAWIFDRTVKALDPSERPERVLIGYAIDQFTLHSVTRDQLLHLLVTPPYSSSRYARTVLTETSGALQLAAARYEAAVAAKTSDPAWRELLITAPQRGAAAWQAAAMKHKDALAHSDAFAAGNDAGCEAQLRPDLIAIAKPMPHATIEALRDAISDDPLAGLLLHRLVHCLVVAGNVGQAQTLERLGESVRVMAGPQMAAYYATVDAVNNLGDKTRVKASDLLYPAEPVEDHGAHIDDFGVQGVIASVSKHGDKVHVTFVQTRVQYMSQKCVETNKVDRIEANGKLIYRQACHDTGLVWGDTTERPLDVRASTAGGLAAGRFAKFNDQMSNDVVPGGVFADKNGKHMIAFGGLLLE